MSLGFDSDSGFDFVSHWKRNQENKADFFLKSALVILNVVVWVLFVIPQIIK